MGTALSAGKETRHGLWLKRGVDLIGASMSLVLLSPLLIVSYMVVWAVDGRPVLFTQFRAGRDSRPFRILKFRTMKASDRSAIEVGQVDLDHPGLTRTGKLLRRFKVDEVLQMANVIKGEMSLVGPRPALPEQVRSYSEFEMRRLQVRPGITGWAQVNGNVQLSWEERILLDIWYIDHWSLRLDLEILARTLGVVASGEKIRPEPLKRAKEYADRIGRSG